MITALPEGLRGAVEKAARLNYECWLDEVGCYAPPGESSVQSFEEGQWLEEAEATILTFLNAALDAGVAREIPDDQALIAYAVFDDKFPALIIRTGP